MQLQLEDLANFMEIIKKCVHVFAFVRNLYSLVVTFYSLFRLTLGFTCYQYYRGHRTDHSNAASTNGVTRTGLHLPWWFYSSCGLSSPLRLSGCW